MPATVLPRGQRIKLARSLPGHAEQVASASKEAADWLASLMRKIA